MSLAQVQLSEIGLFLTYFFFFYFKNFFIIFFPFNIVLVLPYINMHPPWVYTCSPSSLPIPSLWVIPVHQPQASCDGNENPVCETAKETQMYRTVFLTYL